MMRRILSVVLVAAVVGGGVWAYLYSQSIGNAPKYRLAKVERGALTAAVSATGNLNAVITVQVGSQVSGQIKELLVDFNSVVKKAQVVARIDPEIFEAKVNQAKGELESATGKTFTKASSQSDCSTPKVWASLASPDTSVANGGSNTYPVAKAQVTACFPFRMFVSYPWLQNGTWVVRSDRTVSTIVGR